MQTENACRPLNAKNTPFFQNIFQIIHIFQQIINDVIYFRWIKSSDIKKCELCKFTFVMQSKVKRHLQTSRKWLTVAIWLDDCHGRFSWMTFMVTFMVDFHGWLLWMTFMHDFYGWLSRMIVMDDYHGWLSWMTFMHGLSQNIILYMDNWLTDGHC